MANNCGIIYLRLGKSNLWPKIPILFLPKHLEPSNKELMAFLVSSPIPYPKLLELFFPIMVSAMNSVLIISQLDNLHDFKTCPQSHNAFRRKSSNLLLPLKPTNFTYLDAGLQLFCPHHYFVQIHRDTAFICLELVLNNEWVSYPSRVLP